METLDGASSPDTNSGCSNNYGCILYQAPERLVDLIDESYDAKQSDCWSLGVLLYTLAFGKYPFHCANLDVLKGQILDATFRLPHTERSFKLNQLVTSLLSKTPSKRPTTIELLESDEWWLNSMNEESNRNVRSSIKLINHRPADDGRASSSKEYYSKLSKLIKSTMTSIQLDDSLSPITSRLDSTDFKLDNVDQVSIVYYCLNSLNRKLRTNLINHQNAKQINSPSPDYSLAT